MQDKGYFMKAKAKSHQLDMLHGSIWNKLPRFALPVAATAILEQLFNASDVAVVGNFAGDAAEKTAAVAAVGANTAIIGLIVNLFVGIALGANVVIANAIGRDDQGCGTPRGTYLYSRCTARRSSYRGNRRADRGYTAAFAECPGRCLSARAALSAHLSARDACHTAV